MVRSYGKTKRHFPRYKIRSQTRFVTLWYTRICARFCGGEFGESWSGLYWLIVSASVRIELSPSWRRDVEECFCFLGLILTLQLRLRLVLWPSLSSKQCVPLIGSKIIYLPIEKAKCATWVFLNAPVPVSDGHTPFIPSQPSRLNIRRSFWILKIHRSVCLRRRASWVSRL